MDTHGEEVATGYLAHDGKVVAWFTACLKGRKCDPDGAIDMTEFIHLRGGRGAPPCVG